MHRRGAMIMVNDKQQSDYDMILLLIIMVHDEQQEYGQ